MAVGKRPTERDKAFRAEPEHLGLRLLHSASRTARRSSTRSARRRRQRPATGEMVYTDLREASEKGDAAAVERHLKQNPQWVHERAGVRSARVG